MSSGIALGWSAPAVPVLLGLQADPQPLRLTLEQGSWVGALLPLSSLGGALVAGPLAERVGRKGALQAFTGLTLLGGLLMTFAGQSLWLLMAGRSLTGVAAGGVHSSVALYCEEIADVRIRGRLGSYQYFVNCLGILWIYSLGALLPYFWFTASSLLPPLAFFFVAWWVPESPAYLATRGRPTDAHTSLRWLRGKYVDFDHELEILTASKSRSSSDGPPKISFSPSLRKPWRSTALRSLAILVVQMILQQMAGQGLFTFYLVQIFQETYGNFSSHMPLMFAGLAFIIGVFLSFLVVDRIGRRFVLFISSIAAGVCLIALSLYAYFSNSGYDVSGWEWFPVTLVLVYLIVYSIGIGPVPWYFIGELLPMYAKGWAPPIVVSTNKILMFLVVKQSLLMLEYSGQVPTYLMFAFFCFLTAAFVFLCVPETKNKTKADILSKIGGDLP